MYHQPVTFFTNDGVERRFSLTNSKLLRQIRRIAPDGETDAQSSMAMLYECCDDKDGLSPEQFVDLLPMGDPEVIQGLSAAIKEEYDAKSRGDARNDKFRPKPPETLQTNGSGEPHSTV